ncbi:N-methyl-L-tryptophan oxidase [Oscillochloris sp. ZM17-4]|uniref:N-methyl-L-tryptophan oxidase n=1 Tax=Oscillochloris sp. ZM17-4 TaxID=2866714 RepID=UPI001C72E6B8|nr:N-methyl-L-tryptophan oxidase [Oscillochloris sp. ZM17-4]MBX0329144.1 N-methyl-L-tryptophan oxidase [Oscillochloris sp. ZM17-4]
MSETYDTIILGLGAMGSASAYHLARRGQRVLGLERFTPAHDQGSSHGQTRIIRLSYYEDPAYVPLLLRAYELWQDLSAGAAEPVLRITGSLMIGDPDSPVVAGSVASAREHGLPHQILDAAEIRRRHPIFTPAAGEIALYEEIGGMVYPEAAIRAHLRGAGAAGAALRFEEPAIAWEAAPSGDRVRVTTARGVYEAGRLLIAAGAYAPALLEGTGLPLTVQRNVLYWFTPARDAELFAPERCPVYIWDALDHPPFYGFPMIDADPTGVKVAFHSFGPRCTPETIDRSVHDDEVAHMRGWLAARIPALADGALGGTATCMYTLTPDHDFLMDRHPLHPQVIICSPCSGHGYKFASVVGEIMADLLAQGDTAHPIGKFCAGRFVG